MSNHDYYWPALVRLICGTGGGVAPVIFSCPGGKGGSPGGGGKGGSLVTRLRQVSRSAGEIAFHCSAFLRNWTHSSRLILANLRKELMQTRRCSGGSFSNARRVFSISPRSASESALRVFSFSLADRSKYWSKRSHIR